VHARAVHKSILYPHCQVTQSPGQSSHIENMHDARDLHLKAGPPSYLEVLDSDTRYFTAQLALAQAQLRELSMRHEILFFLKLKAEHHF
jgi:hypothetical protein